jgi:hypothetical protein
MEAGFLRAVFKRVLLFSAAVITIIFACALAVEWIRSTYTPFHGFIHFRWYPQLQTFLYLMAMFNILIIRYVIMRIHLTKDYNDFLDFVRSLSKADFFAMLISGLPCFYGLLLFLLKGDVVDFYLLFGLSNIYLLIYFPRYKNWVSIIEQNLRCKNA